MTDQKSEDRPAGDEPERIGPYRILDVLGEGGMAVVYLAEQSEPVRRRVALKILKPGMDTKQVIARFESERQALAVLDHPNIAKVFDGGVTETGRPYFAMERVRGIPITDYCDDHRLGTEQRVRLFIDVCSAVQHAHHKGLIHRDIKPSNLLVGVVDGKPQVKVIDFGIAKAATPSLTEQTLLTRIGQIVGTPQYMSPEQADSSGIDVDTRTDIYSLGVVLYELLVGIVPLNLAAIGDQAMRLALLEKDPPKPSTRVSELGDTVTDVARARRTDPAGLVKELKGDLDWVVMQAIAKDRTERYETVNALAMECRRYLNHEPVLARPPSAGYLLRRFVRRNRLMVGAASIALIAIIAGATAATLGFIRATEAERIAVREAAIASETTSFLVDLFQVSNPWASTAINPDVGADVSAREILETGAERIADELDDQPEVRAALMTAIGRVFMGLGLPDRAQSLVDEALDIRKRHYPPQHIAIGDSLMANGMYHLMKGDYATAAAQQGEAIGIYETAWGRDAPGLAWMLNRQAVTLANAGRLQDAIDMSLRSVTLLRDLEAPDPYVFADALNNLGFVYNSMSRFDEAAGHFEEALASITEDEFPGLYSRVLGNLAAAYMQMGRLAESRRVHERGLTLRRKYFGPEHIETAYSIANLAYLYQYFGEYEQSEALARESIRIFSARLGEQHPNIAIILGGLGWTLTLKGDHAAAASVLDEALTRLHASVGSGSVHEPPVLNALAENQARQGNVAAAEARFRESLAILEQAGVELAHTGRALAGLARLDSSSLDADERLAHFEEAIRILENTEGLGTPDAAIHLIDFGAFLHSQGLDERARNTFGTGLVHLEDALGTDNPRYLEQLERYRALFGADPGS